MIAHGHLANRFGTQSNRREGISHIGRIVVGLNCNLIWQLWVGESTVELEQGLVNEPSAGRSVNCLAGTEAEIEDACPVPLLMHLVNNVASGNWRFL